MGEQRKFQKGPDLKVRRRGTEGARGWQLRYIAGDVKLNLKLVGKYSILLNTFPLPVCVLSLSKSLRGAPLLPRLTIQFQPGHHLVDIFDKWMFKCFLCT